MEFKKFFPPAFTPGKAKGTEQDNKSKFTPKKIENLEEFDNILFWAITFIVSIGFIMVYSASLAIAEGSKMTNFNPYFFIMRHGIFLTIGIVLGFITFKIPLNFWRERSLPLFLIGASLLVIVLIPHIGKDVNGARRWIGLGPINFQPSELMKILSVLYASDYISRKKDILNNFKMSFFPMVGVITVIGFLLLREPDFGAFIVISFISFGILFLGGVKLRGYIFLIIMAVLGFIAIVWTSPYRLARIVGFLDPWQDPYGKGYQLSHSLIAFGRGEIFGVGLGGSVEKLFYLPEAHTDFLMAVIGEEFGLIGVMTIVGLFATVVYRAFKIGAEAAFLQRHYPSLVAQGMGLWFGFQAFINIGVNVGLLPTKGLTLPFMSFGGSSIVANFIGIAILFRVDADNRKLVRRRHDKF
jgi:cell division protein FtsW